MTLFILECAACYDECDFGSKGEDMLSVPSPAIAIVGRHNSGKTTLIEKLIAELVARGVDVGSVKHHSHAGFDIDIPGKDSYRHRAAGASETVIACPGQMATIKTIEGEAECADIVASMPGHDIVIVEGYRKSGLPTIEIMRAANEADRKTAEAFAKGAAEGLALGTDFTQMGKSSYNDRANATPASADSAQTAEGDIDYMNIEGRMPTAQTVAVATDIPCAIEAAAAYGIPAFDPNDVAGIADFLEAKHVRERITVVIQAGGESRRMGQSKATVPFCGRPLICRLVERLRSVADEMVITTNEPENLQFLFEMYPDINLKLAVDSYTFRGALPGLCTALKAASNKYVAIVACDMVFASAPLILAEAKAMSEHKVSAVVPKNKHGYEPFHAVYKRDECLEVARKGVEAGEQRAQYIIGNVDIYEFSQQEVLASSPRGGCFINANRPNELHELEELVLGGLK